MYQEIILDHYRNPHHRGLRDPFDAEVHHVNPTCGDEVTVRVSVADGVVADVSYESEGCSISQASASVMSDLVIGRTVENAMALEEEFLALMRSRGTVEPDEDTLEDAVAFAGVSKYPARVKCALLSWMAWKDATSRALDTRDAPGSASSAEAAAPAPGIRAPDSPAPGISASTPSLSTPSLSTPSPRKGQP
jgi:nitrogen fixation NifU-like protein